MNEDSSLLHVQDVLVRGQHERRDRAVGDHALARRLLEVVEVTPVDQVTYAPDHPMFSGGSLGSCNPGA